MSIEELQIIIPMAGRGSRFAEVGYQDPKPLIRMPDGRRMIELVIDNLRPTRPHRFTFVVREEHRTSFALDAVLERSAPGCRIIDVPAVTQGAAETVALAARAVPPDAPVMVANCDQYVELSIDDYLRAGEERDCDGFIMTMAADHPKWSYAAVDAAGWVTAVVEKQVISPHATVGIYNFGSADGYLRAYDAMVRADRRVNGEFYVAPTYDEMVRGGAKIYLVAVESLGGAMHGLGVPDDLERFQERFLLAPAR